MASATSKNNAIKINKMLLSNPSDKDTILNEFKIKSATLYKYLEVIRKAGFLISKKEGKYSSAVFLDELNLAEFEISLIAYTMCRVYADFPYKDTQALAQILNKILLLSNQKTHLSIIKKFKLYKRLFLANEYPEKIQLIQKYIKAKSEVIIATDGKTERLLMPVSIDWERREPVVNFVDKKNNETYNFSISKIVKIAPLNQKKAGYKTKETIFELYGRLAKSYLLKEGERIVDKFKDRLVIANCSNDKEALFQRLLKYDSFCRIILPKEDVKKFTKLIDLSIENLDKLQDNISNFIKV